MFEKRASFIWSEWRDSNARPLAPKASALPLGYTRILNNCIYTIKSGGRKGFCRCGQTCGQRPMFERFAGKGKCQNPSVCKGLRNFGILRMGGGVTRSQTRRDTNFAIPGYPIFPILPRLSTKSNRACGNVARKKDRWVSRKKLPAHQAERADALYPAVQL